MASYLESTFGLRGKRAVVTGAGIGIGKAIAQALAAAGADVLVHYHSSREPAEALVKEIAASGGKAWSCGADLTDPRDADSLFKRVEEKWGALDILVNNAGDLVKRAKIAELNDETIEKILRVNIHTALHAIRYATPLLKKASDARSAGVPPASPCILNLSSVAAHHGGGNGAVLYAATKGAILTLTRGTAKECAAAAQFLCGPGAAFITGETIEINGGLWLA